MLSLLEAPLAWLTGGYLRWGDLNLIGLTNPLSQTHPNEILWGDVSRWTADQEMLWGDTIYNARRPGNALGRLEKDRRRRNPLGRFDASR